MSILKTGEITTKELINIFGTTKLKQRYEKDKRLGGKDKTTVLNKANIYCNIEDLGRGKYFIHKVYSMINEQHIIPLKKGLYKYIIPLVLTKLLNEQDENYKITLPFLGWVRKFEIVNNNYSVMKYHQEESSQYFKINEDIMFEYFTKIDSCIRYYLTECLEKLSNKKTLDLIDYDCVTMVKKYFNKPITNDLGSLDYVSCENYDEIISDEDHKFVIDCEQEARIYANINQPKEQYYGEKSLKYKNKLTSLLSKRNIKYTYTAYNIFCKNKEGIKDVIDQFQYTDDCDFVQDFNKYFIEYVNHKATIRHTKEAEKKKEGELNGNIDEIFLQEHRLLETYLDEINKLSEITLKYGYPNIHKHLNLKEETLEDIVNEFNIGVRKRK